MQGINDFSLFQIDLDIKQAYLFGEKTVQS